MPIVPFEGRDRTATGAWVVEGQAATGFCGRGWLMLTTCGWLQSRGRSANLLQRQRLTQNGQHTLCQLIEGELRTALCPTDLVDSLPEQQLAGGGDGFHGVAIAGSQSHRGRADQIRLLLTDQPRGTQGLTLHRSV